LQKFFRQYLFLRIFADFTYISWQVFFLIFNVCKTFALFSQMFRFFVATLVKRRFIAAKNQPWKRYCDCDGGIVVQCIQRQMLQIHHTGYAQLRSCVLLKLGKPKERQRKIREKPGATYFTVYKKQFITNGAL
jgi:hypothetical protein